MFTRIIAIVAATLLCGCSGLATSTGDAAPTPFSLPAAHSNNAVAIAQGTNGPTLFSFNGLRGGKSHADISNAAFACAIMARRCDAIDDVPVPQGRLASVAVTLGLHIYVIGGYSVAKDGSEISEPEMHRLDPLTGDYERMADMPVPVDDAVAVAYKDRYIYLISGWHDKGNVVLVQLYDSKNDSWSRASDFLGPAVFGHAGGIIGGSILIADGVKILPEIEGAARFVPSNDVWRGDIDPANPARIVWRKVKPHPGAPLYRMAAAGSASRGQVIFAGGSDNPYNFDGIGYDGTPSAPSPAIFGYDFASDSWRAYAAMPTASMDHRGLLLSGDKAYIVGGMDGERSVIADIAKFTLTPVTANEKAKNKD
ncbi:MAG: hypothetical protein V3V15_06590 [Sphingorhabdus sp.]